MHTIAHFTKFSRVVAKMMALLQEAIICANQEERCIREPCFGCSNDIKGTNTLRKFLHFELVKDRARDAADIQLFAQQSKSFGEVPYTFFGADAESYTSLQNILAPCKFLPVIEGFWSRLFTLFDEEEIDTRKFLECMKKHEIFVHDPMSMSCRPLTPEYLVRYLMESLDRPANYEDLPIRVKKI